MKYWNTPGAPLSIVYSTSSTEHQDMVPDKNAFAQGSALNAASHTRDGAVLSRQLLAVLVQAQVCVLVAAYFGRRIICHDVG